MFTCTIHRGTHEIGGTCVEVQCKGSRIILDLGLPLMGRNGVELDFTNLTKPSVENGILPNVEGLYKFQKPSVDAVFITHPHLDHYGLLDFVHPAIPIYLSKGAQKVIEVGNMFQTKETIFQNSKNYTHWNKFTIGPFSITAYLMDHSAFDSSAFLIESEGKKIFYTGDFRGHGRKGKVLNNLIKNPITDVNCLVMEGTTLGGSHEGYRYEIAVEQKMQELFVGQKDLMFVIASGSNIDRMVSIYKAATKAGKTLVLDLYTIYLLDELKKEWPSLPPHKLDNIRVFYIKQHADSLVNKIGVDILYKYKPRKIEIDEIIKFRQKMVVKLPLSAQQRIARAADKEKNLNSSKLIYSLWAGYLDKNSATDDFCKKYKIEMIKIHTSGHAYLKDLQRLSIALKSKALIPVHTSNSNDFGRYFSNVVQLDDGVPFEID